MRCINTYIYTRLRIKLISYSNAYVECFITFSKNAHILILYSVVSHSIKFDLYQALMSKYVYIN
jgi:hypothetical protein